MMILVELCRRNVASVSGNKNIIITIIIVLGLLMSYCTITCMKRVKAWDNEKFKRTREINKLREFAEKLNKPKEKKDGSIKSKDSRRNKGNTKI